MGNQPGIRDQYPKHENTFPLVHFPKWCAGLQSLNKGLATKMEDTHYVFSPR